jgi:hypothetical protein
VEKLFLQPSSMIPNAGVRDTNFLPPPQELPDESFLGSERKGVEQAIADGGLAITASIKYPILG